MSEHEDFDLDARIDGGGCALVVTNLDRSLAFYSRLGFTLMQSSPDRAQARLSTVTIDLLERATFNVPAGREWREKARDVVLFCQSESAFDEVAEHVERMDLSRGVSSYRSAGGGRCMVLTDPDGYRIEIIEYEQTRDERRRFPIKPALAYWWSHAPQAMVTDAAAPPAVRDIRHGALLRELESADPARVANMVERIVGSGHDSVDLDALLASDPSQPPGQSFLAGLDRCDISIALHGLALLLEYRRELATGECRGELGPDAFHFVRPADARRLAWRSAALDRFEQRLAAADEQWPPGADTAVMASLQSWCRGDTAHPDDDFRGRVSALLEKLQTSPDGHH